MIIDLLSVTHVLIAAVLGGVAVLGWTRIQSPAVDFFGVTAGVGAIGGLFLAAGFFTRSVDLIFAATVTLGLLLPVPWAAFTFDYTGMEQLVSDRVISLLAAPVALGLGATLLVFGPQIVSGFEPWSAIGPGPLATAGRTFLNVTQWLALLYAGGLMLAGSALLVWTFQRYAHLDQTTGIALGTFGTVSWLSTLFGIQLNSISTLALGSTLAIGLGTSAATGVALVGPSPLFERVPAAGNIGPTTVVENLEDLVVVTDEDGRILELNPTTRRRLDVSAGEVLGFEIEDVVGMSLETIREEQTLALEAPGGRVVFEPSISELTDRHDHLLGYAVVLRDMTERTVRRQRLRVLNRVLRHNLRNNMTAIMTQASLIQSRASEETISDGANSVIESSEELLALSEKARDADDVFIGLEGDEGDEGDTSLGSLVTTALESVTDSYPELIYQVDVPENIVVEGPERLLWMAVQNLIENAAEHNDSDQPEVTISAEYAPDEPYQLQLRVMDNGPGIPTEERQVIETGNETQLHHGSGIGLWIVRWSVTLLNGVMAFEERDPHGTIVTLSLPSAQVRSDRQSAVTAG